MSQEHGGLTVREFAASLGIRLGTAYSLLYDGTVGGRKNENGEWIVSPESVERYRLRRNLRRAAPRSALQRRAIDVTKEVTRAEA